MKKLLAQCAFLLPSAALVFAGTLAGAVVMGIIIPTILFVATVMISGDIGGPLFWPIFVLFMLMLGTALGFGYSIFWVALFWLLRCLIPRQYQVAPTWHCTFRKRCTAAASPSSSAAALQLDDQRLPTVSL